MGFGSSLEVPRLLAGFDNDGDCGAGSDFINITFEQPVLSCSFQDHGLPRATADEILTAWRTQRAAGRRTHSDLVAKPKGRSESELMGSVWTRWRISGVAGILFVALSFVAAGMNVLPPAYDQDGAVFVAWLARNGQSFRLWHFVAGIAFLLFYFPFFAGFCERLREAEGAPATWSRVAWAGAIVWPAAGTTSGAFIMGVALLGPRASPEVAMLGAAAQHYAAVVSGAFGGVVMIGAAVVIVRTGIFWRWLGWAGAVFGLAAVVGCAAIVETNPEGVFASINGLAWLANFLWIGAVAVAMLRIREAPTTTDPCVPGGDSPPPGQRLGRNEQPGTVARVAGCLAGAEPPSPGAIEADRWGTPVGGRKGGPARRQVRVEMTYPVHEPHLDSRSGPSRRKPDKEAESESPTLSDQPASLRSD